MAIYDKDKIKNKLDIEQVILLVMDLGASSPIQHGTMFMCETICHNLPGEGSNKLYYYDNTKLFKCYTHCGEYFDIFQLVVKAKETQDGVEWSLPKAVAYVAQMFDFETEADNGFDDIQIEDWSVFKAFDRINTKVVKEKKVIELKEYDSTILKNLPNPLVESWVREGITKEVMDFYNIGFYPTNFQITIPHFDDEGRFVGLRGRTLCKEDGEMYGKYIPLRLINGFMYNHPLGFCLYGLYQNKENISAVKKAIVFEGEKSVLLYGSIFGQENNIAVASCGSSISNFQFELLIKYGVQEVIIAFDRQFKEIGDSEFKLLIKNLKQLSNKFKNYVTVSVMFDKECLLDYKSSPIDHGRETFLKLFQDRIIM